MESLIGYKRLPYMSSDLSGIGGKIKSEIEDFRVEEIALYEPSGCGEHIYVSITRSGWTTRDVVHRLATLFCIDKRDIGYAGIKDKWARTTQTFSMSLREYDELAVESKIHENTPFHVNWVKRHTNKLRVGHLLGNRFSIILRELRPDVIAYATKIRDSLLKNGIPNFFGQQRFSHEEENIVLAKQILEGKRVRDPWLRRFALSAYQSALFNHWLVKRIERGMFHQVFIGDIAKKTDTGALFEVRELDSEMARFRAHEITYTGPIYGKKMRRAGAEAGLLEMEVLQLAEISIEKLGCYKLNGSRRGACLFLREITIREHAQGLQFMFHLPKGAYATIVMREFMKADETANI